MCCDKLATTQYFFEKKNVTCCGKFVAMHYFFESQYIIFFQKILCCAPCPQHNTFFGKNVVTQKIICSDKLARTHYFLKK